MQTSGLTERVEAALLDEVFSDDVLENRVRSLRRWKIRACRGRERSCNTFWPSHLRLGPRNC